MLMTYDTFCEKVKNLPTISPLVFAGITTLPLALLFNASGEILTLPNSGTIDFHDDAQGTEVL
jgi:hypothetical protein